MLLNMLQVLQWGARVEVLAQAVGLNEGWDTRHVSVSSAGPAPKPFWQWLASGHAAAPRPSLGPLALAQQWLPGVPRVLQLAQGCLGAPQLCCQEWGLVGGGCFCR